MSGDSTDSVILIGGGGHCRSVIDVIEQGRTYKIAGVIDLPSQVGKSILGYPVIASDEALPQLRKEYAFAVITVGQLRDNATRVKLFNLLKSYKFNLPVIVSPLAYVSQHADVGEGTVVMHHAVINAGAKVGANCIVNTKALLEHDVVVGDHCHISTASVLNGSANVASSSFVGSNASTRQEAKLSGFIKAGSINK